MEWTRCLNTDGYPRAVVGSNNNIKVHRLVYELSHDEDITGKVIRHTCDNIICINPSHLESGTFADNNQDRDKRGRHSSYSLTNGEVRLMRVLFHECEFTIKELAEAFNYRPYLTEKTVHFNNYRHVCMTGGL